MRSPAGTSPCAAPDEELTYRDVIERCDRLAAGLVGLGLERGDRVAVVGRQLPPLPRAVPGGARRRDGARAAQPAPHRCRARATPSPTRAPACVFTNREIAGLPPCVERVIDLADGYEQLLADAPAVGTPVVEPDDADLAGLFYTGGTTGAAKGVMLTHRNLLANALHFQAYGGFDRDTVWLIVAPLFHAAGSIAVLATVWHGGRQIVLPAFDAGQALDLIEAHRVTATLVVPTMLSALNDEQLARPRDVSSLRSISHGGSPTATETLRRAHQAFPAAELVHIYGATETSPIATVMRHEEERPRRPAGVVVRAAGDRRRDRRARRGRCGRPCRRRRRDRHPRGQRDARLLEQARARRPRRSSTAGTAAATSATSTRSPTCSSSTGPRT